MISDQCAHSEISLTQNFPSLSFQTLVINYALFSEKRDNRTRNTETLVVRLVSDSESVSFFMNHPVSVSDWGFVLTYFTVVSDSESGLENSESGNSNRRQVVLIKGGTIEALKD